MNEELTTPAISLRPSLSDAYARAVQDVFKKLHLREEAVDRFREEALDLIPTVKVRNYEFINPDCFSYDALETVCCLIRSLCFADAVLEYFYSSQKCGI